MTGTEIVTVSTLTALVDHATATLYAARSAAEVIEAFELARETYAQAKRMKAMAKAKKARDELIEKINHVQADALSIKADAEKRLADEYDAAQERGEVARNGQHQKAVPDGNSFATAADIGLSRKAIFHAREVRDAEKKEPGIVRRVLNEAIANGREPNATLVRNAVRSDKKPRKSDRDKNLDGIKVLSQIGVLKKEWDKATKSARVAFLHDLGLSDAETVERLRKRNFRMPRMHYARTLPPIHKLPVLDEAPR